jgi:hypothetical protein
LCQSIRAEAKCSPSAAGQCYLQTTDTVYGTEYSMSALCSIHINAMLKAVMMLIRIPNLIGFNTYDTRIFTFVVTIVHQHVTENNKIYYVFCRLFKI